MRHCVMPNLCVRFRRRSFENTFHLGRQPEADHERFAVLLVHFAAVVRHAQSALHCRNSTFLEMNKTIKVSINGWVN